MLDYHQEILEENKEIIEKYVFETKIDNIYAIRYYPGRDFTFGYDFIYVYFLDKFEALIFLMKHKESCQPK